MEVTKFQKNFLTSEQNFKNYLLNSTVVKTYMPDLHDNVGDVKPRAIISQLPVANFGYTVNCCMVAIF